MLDDARGNQMTAFHDNMGCLPIQRVSYRMQLLQLRQWVCNMQQRAVSIVARTLKQQDRWHIQVHNPARIMKAAAIFRIEDDASTGGHHNIGTLREFVNGLHLATPKPLLTLYFEDRRDGYASTLNYFMVGVEKWTT